MQDVAHELHALLPEPDTLLLDLLLSGEGDGGDLIRLLELPVFPLSLGQEHLECVGAVLRHIGHYRFAFQDALDARRGQVVRVPRFDRHLLGIVVCAAVDALESHGGLIVYGPALVAARDRAWPIVVEADVAQTVAALRPLELSARPEVCLWSLVAPTEV